jgi:hypothetical protein
MEVHFPPLPPGNLQYFATRVNANGRKRNILGRVKDKYSSESQGKDIFESTKRRLKGKFVHEGRVEKFQD